MIRINKKNVTKSIILATLTASLALSLAACGSNSETTENDVYERTDLQDNVEVSETLDLENGTEFDMTGSGTTLVEEATKMDTETITIEYNGYTFNFTPSKTVRELADEFMGDTMLFSGEDDKTIQPRNWYLMYFVMGDDSSNTKNLIEVTVDNATESESSIWDLQAGRILLNEQAGLYVEGVELNNIESIDPLTAGWGDPIGYYVDPSGNVTYIWEFAGGYIAWYNPANESYNNCFYIYRDGSTLTANLTGLANVSSVIEEANAETEIEETAKNTLRVGSDAGENIELEDAEISVEVAESTDTNAENTEVTE